MTALGTVYVNKGKPLPFWFSVDVAIQPIQITANSDSPYTEDDKEGTNYLAAETGELAAITVVTSYSIDTVPVAYAFSSDNSAKIEVDALGSIVYQVPPEETSSATITVTGTQGGVSIARQVVVTLTISGASNIIVVEGGVVGSARKALSDPIDNALSGANPLTQKEVYTTQNHTSPSYVRNTSFFLNSHIEALTCSSPWNSVQGRLRAGTAITRRHAVLANHYAYGIGTTVRFVASDNSIITKTVVQAAEVAPSNGANADIWMVLFDSDLPASITPCKLFPAGYDTYLPAASSSLAAQYLPLLYLDQEENGGVLDFWEINEIFNYPQARYLKPILPDRIAFYDGVISGDSGNPVFAAIGSELWLLSTFHGAGSGPFYGGLVSELNAMITTLDTLQGDITGHTVTVGDLSSYTTY